MSCHRCRGLMVPEYAAELGDFVSSYPLLCWRCLNCGELLDDQILANRHVNMTQARLQTASASRSETT